VYGPREPAVRARLLPGGPHVEFPGGEAAATVRMIVDTAGRVEPESVALVSGDPGFGASLVRVAPQWRFRPAEAPRGCRVRQMAVIPVEVRRIGTTCAASSASLCPRPALPIAPQRLSGTGRRAALYRRAHASTGAGARAVGR
jgi:TonB family protein